MTNNAQTYFASVAGQWGEIRSGYFTEHLRDSAIAKASLPENATVADIGAGTGFVLPDATLDGVFANMYLHHAPDPLAAIREMARLLKPGGVLCITDLDAHDHEWQRAEMADLWLGFARDDIRRWFDEAGLSDIDVDCAEGTCDACGPDGEVKPLSIFAAIGRKA